MKMTMRRLLLVLLLGSFLPAQSTPVMSMDADSLVRGAGFLKETLHLTPNQQMLWQQVTVKSAGLLRARQTRRDKLQASVKGQLQDPAQDLRTLAPAMELEAALSQRENAELRELWLTVNDAMNDQQRVTVNQFLVSLLERVDAPERTSGGKGAEPSAGGQRRQKPGGDMGGARF